MASIKLATEVMVDINTMLNALGISRTEAGFPFVSEMVRSLSLTGLLNYKAVCKQCQVDEDFFRQAINNSIQSVKEKGGLKIINAMLNYEACKEDIIITPSEFIYLISQCLTKQQAKQTKKFSTNF